MSDAGATTAKESLLAWFDTVPGRALKVVLTADALLLVLYLIGLALATHIHGLFFLLDLKSEGNPPTWWYGTQQFLVGMTFLLLAAGQIRPALGPKLKRATSIFMALTILFGAVLGLQAANHFSSQTAVVVSAEATARSGPFDEAQNAFTARDGAELRVLDRHDDWVQLADGAGKIGWLSRKQVEVLPGV